MSFLSFDPEQWEGRTTPSWRVESRGGPLGHVLWYSPWRRYVYESAEDRVYDATCLREIADWCEARTNERKKRRPAPQAADANQEETAE